MTIGTTVAGVAATAAFGGLAAVGTAARQASAVDTIPNDLQAPGDPQTPDVIQPGVQDNTVPVDPAPPVFRGFGPGHGVTGGS